MTCVEVQSWCLESATRRPSDGANAPVEITEHLAQCAACQASLRLDEQVCTLIKQVEVPVDGASTLLWNLRKRRREQQRARVLYWSMSVAAAALLAVMVGWYLQRPFDLNHLAQTVSQFEIKRTITSHTFPAPVQMADLKAWLQRQGVNAVIPKKLKVQYLTTAHIIEVQGRKVPVLELRTGGSTCRVCLLERRYFPERLDRELREQDNLASHIIADSDESSSLGWMIVDQGSAMLFVEDGQLPNGV